MARKKINTMYDPIGINQRSFLAGVLSDHYSDIDFNDVFFGAEGMQRGAYRNLLRMYYNHLYDELYAEVRNQIRDNAHKISTAKAQYGGDKNHISN